MPTANNLRKDARLAREKAAQLLEVAGEKAARLLAYAEALEAAAEKQEGLQSRHGYATVRGMDASTATVAKTGRRGPESRPGPMTDLAKALGLDSLQALALALDENYDNVRSCNSRGRIPAKMQAKADALLKAVAKK